MLMSGRRGSIAVFAVAGRAGSGRSGQADMSVRLLFFIDQIDQDVQASQQEGGDQ